MESLRIKFLEFIGGPFDGFREEIFDKANELPPCVAIPLNARSARTLGVHSAVLQSHCKAIYILQISDVVARYYFQSTIASGTAVNPAVCSSILREPRSRAE